MATQSRWAAIASFDSQVLRALQDPRPDPEPVRLVTRLHVGSSRVGPATWRLVAELLDGHRSLVCVGHTPADARAAARARDLPSTMVALRMQRWVETAEGGRWKDER